MVPTVWREAGIGAGSVSSGPSLQGWGEIQDLYQVQLLAVKTGRALHHIWCPGLCLGIWTKPRMLGLWEGCLEIRSQEPPDLQWRLYREEAIPSQSVLLTLPGNKGPR
jgi:hypothetical protein